MWLVTSDTRNDYAERRGASLEAESSLRQSIPGLRAELLKQAGHDFQGLFGRLLGELKDGSSVSKRLGRLDRAGIDALVVTSAEDRIETAIQCKGFELFDYGPEQHAQCRAEIEKYLAKGPDVSNYWLVINRPIKDRVLREELNQDLARLRGAGKARTVELLDLEPLIDKLVALAAERLADWAAAKRIELFHFYRERLEFVEHIAEVPFNGDSVQTNPVQFLLTEAQRFFAGLREHETGKYGRTPKFIVSSEFGFGKTSTLQALAGRWADVGGHLIYVPAALLEDRAFTNAAGLADAILTVLLPDDADISALGHQAFRDVLRYTLRTSKDWLVLIDGIDENAAAFRPNSLAILWNIIRDLGVPAVLSARDELIEARASDFFPDQGLRIAPAFKRLRLMDWTDDLILEFVRRFAAARGGCESASFSDFRQTIESRRYVEVYGDIPKRPLFLGMLAEDAWSGDEPARQLHRLYGKYFRKKFLLDRHSIAAGGATKRASPIVEVFGSDEASDRLMRVMEDAAARMFEAAERSERTTARQHDTLGEGGLREIGTEHGVPVFQLEDITMHSLLQPAERDAVSRERLVRFAHRSFQEWFLARHYAREGHFDARLPRTAARFLSSMRASLEAGEALP
jgi:hypothetical protein